MPKSSRGSGAKVQLDLCGIGRRVRELRGFYCSQAEFARRIGVTQGYVSALERGAKEPGATVLVAISREFGKSVDWLLTGDLKQHKNKARATTT
jgi:transcriptional regulator with XRE-family HTH domain